ncbi:MAG TPA: RNA-binding protein [Chitinophagaceae bacterium]|jgi:RNA recognition motif-containing protein|nr:RNA-binding protein [Chitinophagaceae bacterium]
MNIHVSNLSLNVIDADIRRLFSAYGEVLSASIIRDKLNGRSKGLAIIDMVNDSQARQAILCLDQTEVDGRAIAVSEIKYSPGGYKSL